MKYLVAACLLTILISIIEWRGPLTLSSDTQLSEQTTQLELGVFGEPQKLEAGSLIGKDAPSSVIDREQLHNSEKGVQENKDINAVVHVRTPMDPDDRRTWRTSEKSQRVVHVRDASNPDDRTTWRSSEKFETVVKIRTPSDPDDRSTWRDTEVSTAIVHSGQPMDPDDSNTWRYDDAMNTVIHVGYPKDPDNRVP